MPKSMGQFVRYNRICSPYHVDDNRRHTVDPQVNLPPNDISECLRLENIAYSGTFKNLFEYLKII